MPIENRDALVISPEPPYPLMGGGALRTASLIHHLRATREVDLITFREHGTKVEIPAGLARRVLVIELPRHRRTPMARVMRNAMRLARGVPPLVDRFSGFELEIQGRYGIGIIEHFWCAPYHEQIGHICSRTVLDLHNIESCLHERCAAAERGAAAFAHRAMSEASRELERIWLPRFSQVLAVSDDDARRAREIAPSARVSVYPNALPIEAGMPVPDQDEEAIVFSGNLEYHPNVSAVRFFRGEVWPQLRERWPKLTWRLVGKNPDAVRNLVSGDSRIQVRGPVNDAIAELARARVAVVPLLAGSGTRFKILEAWAAGVPVVSTSIGAEGLPVRDGEHLLLADGAAAFRQSVTRLLACPDLRRRLRNAGRSLLEKEFTWEKAWQKLEF